MTTRIASSLVAGLGGFMVMSVKNALLFGITFDVLYMSAIMAMVKGLLSFFLPDFLDRVMQKVAPGVSGRSEAALHAVLYATYQTTVFLIVTPAFQPWNEIPKAALITLLLSLTFGHPIVLVIYRLGKIIQARMPSFSLT